MNLVRLLFAFAISGLFAVSAFARVGESEQELVRRYGEVTSRNQARTIAQGRTYTYGEYLSFHSDDWSIDVLMINQRCEEISYAKKGDWTEEQLKHLLEINGGRSQWEEQKKPGITTRLWKRRDKTMATLRGGLGLEIKSPVVEQTREAVEKKAKEEASRLPKF